MVTVSDEVWEETKILAIRAGFGVRLSEYIESVLAANIEKSKTTT